MNTLHDKYASSLSARHSRRKALHEKLQNVDVMLSLGSSNALLTERLLAEQAVDMLLLELSKADKSKAMAVIKKLNTIIGVAKKAQLKQLTTAIQTAAGDIEKQGSIGGALKSAIKKKLGVEENPIAKLVTFMSSIEQGFEALPELAKTYSPELKDMKIGPDWADSMMKDVKSDIKRKNNLMMAIPDDKKSEFAKALLDAFKPAEDEGGFLKQVYSLFTGGGKIPYIKDTQALVKEIMEAEVDDLQEISKTLATGTSTSDLSKVMSQMSPGGETQNQQAGSPVASEEQLALAIATDKAKKAGKDQSVAVKAAEDEPKKLIQGFIKDIANKSGKGEDIVQKILKVLIKNKKLKTSVVEGRIALTIDDVIDARKILDESEGSINRWVHLLFEEDNTNHTSEEAKKLAADLKTNDKVLAALAKKLQLDVDELKRKAGGDQETTEAEFVAFIEDLFKTKPNLAAAAQKAVGADSSEKSKGPRGEILKSIENDIKGLDLSTVSAVLDAIPDWMLGESLRRMTLAERVKLRRRGVLYEA